MPGGPPRPGGGPPRPGGGPPRPGGGPGGGPNASAVVGIIAAIPSTALMDAVRRALRNIMFLL
ncbi:hypothetical protein ACH79_13385 [Bradyrhizobium sp. CCBAU 051011]|nr:hypothetical protein ACH79_13385 [Bradyrhizobium sp. CCBAU 051011]